MADAQRSSSCLASTAGPVKSCVQAIIEVMKQKVRSEEVQPSPHRQYAVFLPCCRYSPYQNPFGKGGSCLLCTCVGFAHSTLCGSWAEEKDTSYAAKNFNQRPCAQQMYWTLSIYHGIGTTQVLSRALRLASSARWFVSARARAGVLEDRPPASCPLVVPVLILAV